MQVKPRFAGNRSYFWIWQATDQSLNEALVTRPVRQTQRSLSVFSRSAIVCHGLGALALVCETLPLSRSRVPFQRPLDALEYIQNPSLSITNSCSSDIVLRTRSIVREKPTDFICQEFQRSNNFNSFHRFFWEGDANEKKNI